ncbi:hypothetical protein Rsub_02260 [Raphidocelis subcapitata]|uniref:F-box domain-containing protein n=1 Tax=Raphidocelis subcapitata TaxID=307507 RepID=A0A2V0NSA6_9CHLO|nr:hypothetical protein Rsub_02260 [Raphidocelis subcapitata]|eukprot:GBF89542.1 hypothetical protein Rsub_02260 [Raphidocelis subcapitata]
MGCTADPAVGLQQEAQPTPSGRGLSDLPEETLMNIMRHLDAADLAALLVQDRRLRALAGDGALWQALAHKRWPGCSPDHYGGDYPLLFRSRASLPSDLVRSADRFHALTRKAAGAGAGGALRLNTATLRSPAGPGTGGGSSSNSSSGGGSNSSSSGGGGGGAAAPGSPSKNVYGLPSAPHCNITGMVFEQAMQAAFSFGVALASASPPRAGAGATAGAGAAAAAAAPPCAACGGKLPAAAAAARELDRFRGDAAWWLGARSEAVVRFVRRAAEALREHDVWAGGFSNWPDVPWRRSALQFVLDLALGPASGVCVSVTERLQREAALLDHAIRSLRGDACHLDLRRPYGVPQSHWWFHMGQGLR